MDMVTAGFLCAVAGSTLLTPCPTPNSLGVLSGVVPGSTHTDAVAKWQPLVSAAARRFAIPQAWIGAVMMVESAGRTTRHGRPITSSAGAMGLMQIMPTTYRDVRAQYQLGSDPYNPADNIFAGAAYLRDLYRRYGYPYLFAAYHAGPGRLDAYFASGTPLPTATRAYLDRILPGATITLPLQHQTTASLSAKAVLQSAEQSHSWAFQVTAGGLFFVRRTVISAAAPAVGSAAATSDWTTQTRSQTTPEASPLFVPVRSITP